MKPLSAAMLSLLALLSGPNAGAAISQTNAFLASADVHITFAEAGLASNTAVTNQYAGLGVTFSPVLYQSIDTMAKYSSHGDDQNLANFLIDGPPTTPFSIVFQDDVTAAAFALITNTGDSTFTTLLNGAVQESVVLETSNGVSDPYDIYQFTGHFDEIRVEVGGVLNVMFLDNLQFVRAVPAPSTFVLLGIGLAGLGLTRRRKAK